MRSGSSWLTIGYFALIVIGSLINSWVGLSPCSSS